MSKIIIGGDICPIGKNETPFINGDVEGIFNELFVELKNSDLNIVNLECPFIAQEDPIKKSGPVLSVPEDCINALKKANINVVNLANNHIMDHSSSGLQNTMRVCEKNGIATVGVGSNIDEARKILIQKVNGIRVGILALAEHEFSIATKVSPGANPLDIIDCLRNVKENKGLFDYLILLIHGGKELYSYPTPGLMKICRFFAEEIADAIICQHSHCPVCYETYQGVHIVYGQGNLIFESGKTYNKAWNEGFLVKLKLDKNTATQMELLPYRQRLESYGIKAMSDVEEREFLRDIDIRSKAIQEPNFVDEKWQEFCKKNKYTYLSLIQGYGRVRNFLNRKLHISDTTFSPSARLQVLNVIRCETHREIIEEILNQSTLNK